MLKDVGSHLVRSLLTPGRFSVERCLTRQQGAWERTPALIGMALCDGGPLLTFVYFTYFSASRFLFPRWGLPL